MRCFGQLGAAAGVRVPRDLAPHLPETLWLFQMGILYFWVTDDSPRQQRTRRLLALGSRTVAALLRLSALPFTRPLREIVVELIETGEGRCVVTAAGALLLGAFALGLMQSGLYGLTLFLAVPLLLGALASLFRRPATAGGLR